MNCGVTRSSGAQAHHNLLTVAGAEHQVKRFQQSVCQLTRPVEPPGSFGAARSVGCYAGPAWCRLLTVVAFEEAHMQDALEPGRLGQVPGKAAAGRHAASCLAKMPGPASPHAGCDGGVHVRAAQARTRRQHSDCDPIP